MLGEFGGGQFSTFKTALVDLAVAKLGPIGAEMKKLVQDPVYINSVLADGSAARAGDRRRNHEGGQGHRRLRAPLVCGAGYAALSSRRAACHHCSLVHSSQRI